MRKYLSVFEITVRSRLSSLGDLAGMAILLAIILFVFVQLWRITLGADGAVLEGFTLNEMIWYYVGTETIILSMLPIHRVLEREIREGDVAIRLNKPIGYVSFHAAAFLGEAFVRLFILIGVGGIVTTWLVGPLDFQWTSLPALLLIFFTSLLLNFTYSAIIGLSAFWTEDVTGLFFVMDRMKWLLGGFLLPVSMFPEPLRTLAEWLPFRWMIYEPAKLLVHFSWADFARVLGAQVLVFVVVGGVVALMNHRGLKRLNVNGG
ncbi:MAG: ABC-2 family transporter protein [Bdellovibrionaceae bacterium]|nr:ABC-2 family transporter protein [Pseudobdellovibrionaceae bacterium]